MCVETRATSDKTNLVTSFITGFAPGAVETVCIKYAMYDGSSRLSYWQAKWSRALHQCVEHYSGMHYHGSDLQRASDEPEFSARLPIRHPVRTMISEKPTLTEQEYRAAKERFSVTSLRVIDQGDSCLVECKFANGSSRTEVLPSYIAMNLCGFLNASRDLSALMTSEAGGSA
jgi:hypothetical protein